jgi:uncharacterized cupin superfamily protein
MKQTGSGSSTTLTNSNALSRTEQRGVMSRTSQDCPLAIEADLVPVRTKPSHYPEPFFSRMLKRVKRPLGDYFQLRNIGVNLTMLLPGGESALLHRHSKQDEFIYVLQGEATLITDEGEVELKAGMCAGFSAGGRAHHIVNRSGEPIIYLEVSDRTPGDEGEYPADDLKAALEANGGWRFTHKDGQPY